ncbi:MAG: nitrite reductase (NADH) small subunit [Pseudohongiellaceae bacterium]|jgi:nitrite reductase (NADH) small subunit
MNQMKKSASESVKQVFLCQKKDLVVNSGICVLVGDEQVALFYLPKEQPSIYAISNWDPIGQANVLSRGIVGDIKGELVVASPLFKQHFSLVSGSCLEVDNLTVSTYNVTIEGEEVFLSF